MIDLERKEIKGRAARALLPALVGRAGLTFGPILLAFGGTMILMAAGVIPVDGPVSHGSCAWAVATGFGTLIAAAGALMFVVGIARGLRRGRRYRALHRGRGEPWLADHDWDPRGASDSGSRKIALALAGSAAWFAFLAPFHWPAVSDRTWLLLCFLAVIDAIGLVILRYGVRLLARRYKYGASRVRFDRFPYFLGEAFDAEFINLEGIGLFRSLSFTLRFVEEVMEVRQRDQAVRAARYQVWAEVKTLEDVGEHRGTDVPLPVHFDLPGEGWETRLSKHPPRYWELEVHAETPGVDYRETFLVPVYARPV